SSSYTDGINTSTLNLLSLHPSSFMTAFATQLLVKEPGTKYRLTGRKGIYLVRFRDCSAAAKNIDSHTATWNVIGFDAAREAFVPSCSRKQLLFVRTSLRIKECIFR